MEVASLIEDMVRAGVDPVLIGRTAALLAQRETVLVHDEAAERRRAKDRERKALRNSAEVGGTVEPPCPDKEIPPRNPPKEINPIPDTPLAPQAGGGVDEVEREFDESLWRDFPRHKNSRRSPALKAYRRLKADDRVNCIRGAARYSIRFDDDQADKRPMPERLRFVPHLVTWIHQRGWETELETT